MLKKVFIVSLTILVLLLIVWGAYLLALKNKPEDPDGPFLDDESTAQIITKLTDTIEQVVNTRVNLPVLDTDGVSILYFQKDTGSLYRFNPQTLEKTLVIENVHPGLTTAHWTENRAQVIVQAEDQFWLYNTKAQAPILFKDPNVVDLTWDSLSEKIVYIYRDPSNGERSLNVSNDRGSDWRELKKIGTQKVYLTAIPRSANIAFWPIPKNTTPTVLKQIQFLSGEEKTILTEKYGTDFLWSPSGKKILASFSPNKNTSEVSLAIMNNVGGEFRSLSNTPTIVSKCAWSKDNVHVFCAMPTVLPQDAIMPDDYMSEKIFTKDTFWKLNTQTGTMERIVEMANIKESYDATDLFLSQDETLLYFMDRRSEFLYKIKL